MNTLFKITGAVVLSLLVQTSVHASEITGSVSSDVETSSVGGMVIVSPTISPAGATYTSARTVTLSAPSASRIYYTTNGSNPACGSGAGYTGAAGTQYTGSFTVSSSATVKAISCYLSGSTLHSSSIRSATYTINTPAPSSGGGGGGSTRSSTQNTIASSTPVVTSAASTTPTTTDAALLASLRAQVATLMAQLAALTGQSTNTAAGNTATSIRDLELNMEGTDVRMLQQVLIAQGYPISAGATGFFGTQTQQALSQYQRDNSITPASGYFGEKTRASMKAKGLTGLWW